MPQGRKGAPSLRAREQGRTHLRKLGVRPAGRRRPRISQAAFCHGGLRFPVAAALGRSRLSRSCRARYIVPLKLRRFDTAMNITRIEIWLKGLFAAAISGAAARVLTGFAAVGIDPQHFNLQTGSGRTLRIGAAAALINAVIGVAAYLQKSPLPAE